MSSSKDKGRPERVYIKRLNLRGFKTYAKETTIEFDPTLNTIVGLNGSGKSNCLLALEVCLSWRSFSGEERKQMVHEGTAKLLTAYIEAIFDNRKKKDGTRPILGFDKDEVSLKKSVGEKKEETFVDGKVVNKKEYEEILESMGFSKSNPYYIVRQGKISELTTMDDAKRLDLLREVAGVRSYDEKRGNADNTLNEADERFLGISENIETINSRLKELQQDEKELKDYNVKHRTKLALEYTLNEKEWSHANAKVSLLSSKLRELGQEREEKEREHQSARSRIADEQRKLDAATAEQEALATELEQLQNKLEQVVRDHTSKQLELGEAKKNLTSTNSAKQSLRTELQELQQQIQTEKSALETDLKPKAIEAESEHGVEDQKLNQLTSERDALLAKQGRSKQFNTVGERNAKLDADIADTERRINDAKRNIQTAKNELAALSKKEEDYAKEEEKQKQDKDKLNRDEDRASAKRGKANTDMGQYNERKRELDREIHQLRQDKALRDRERQTLKQELDRDMPQNIRSGNQAAREWCRSNGEEDNCYGTLLENIKVDENLAIAVEVAAGNNLFNMLVRDDRVASNIVGHVRRQRKGKVECTPIARINPSKRALPELNIDDAVPLADHIGCLRPEAEKAIEQVFGKIICAKNLDTAHRLTKQYDVDCVTPHGEKTNRNGVIRGGSTASLKKITRFAELRVVEGKLAEIEKELHDKETEKKQISQQFDGCFEEEAKLGQELDIIRHKILNIVQQQKQRDEEQQKFAQKRKHWEDTIKRNEAETELLNRQIQRLRTERLTMGLGELTEHETQRLTTIAAEIKQLEREVERLRGITKQRRDMVSDAELRLNGGLQKRQREIEELLASPEDAAAGERKETLDREYKTLEKEKRTLESQKERVEQALKEKESVVKKCQKVMDEAQKTDDGLSNELSNFDAREEELMRKREEQEKKKSEANDRMTKIAIASADRELLKYNKMDVPTLRKELAKINEALGAFGSINQKAVDTFTTFKDQAEQLEETHESFKDTRGKIDDFISTMDRKKDETLYKSFGKINTEFKQTFQELVPRGKAKLVLTTMPKEEVEQYEKEQGLTMSRTDKWKGVTIKVSFSGKEDSYYTMQQLSGGQKTVVALAFIFAIQRHDPFHFYLFDEIDAALDSQYRAAVATLIAKQSEKAQFIVTTFRPELIEPADRCFLVTIRDRQSAMKQIDNERAKQTIQEQNEHGANGQIALQ